MLNVLVINAGSSSLKYQLINMTDKSVLAKGLCERIGLAEGRLKHQPSGKDAFILDTEMKNHEVAIKLVLEALTSPEHGVIKSMKEIAAVGHRVVNCASYYANSVLIDDKVKEAIKVCYDLAPLHNPANMTGIEACEKAMPGVPMVAAFDTAFHQTMPAEAYMYAIPWKYYDQYKVRRYGAHGTSHRYVSKRLAEITELPKNAKIITAHLGNGSSLSAILDGKCQDTSMGLTPLSGPCMGTRSGDIDPAIIPFIMEHEGLDTKAIDTLLNKKSGVMAISEVSSDFRDIGEAAEKGNEKAELALKMFSYQCRKIIGSYAAALNGCDALIFTAGIGENDVDVRRRILEGLAYLGIKIDWELNAKTRGKEVKISTPDSKVQVWIVPTNEELMIAMDTVEVSGLKA